MSNISALTGCFLLALNLFLTGVFLIPVSSIVEGYREEIESKGVITEARSSGYPKVLDSFYFTMGSLIVPVAAFVFWKLLSRLPRSGLYAWTGGILWFLILMAFVSG